MDNDKNFLEALDLDNELNTEVGMLNVVAEAKYDMPLISQKFFISALAKIDINNKDFDSINIGLIEFANQNNINKDYLYREKAYITSKTLTAQIMIKDVNADRYIQKNLFSECIYDNGTFTFRFADGMKPYLLDIYSKGGRYFKFIKEYVSKFNSKYTMKLYLLCQSNLWKTNKKQPVIFSVKYMKEFYDLKDKYTAFKDFKRYVLVPAIDEINEKTNLFVTIKLIRVGRKIENIEFLIKDKKQIENVKYIAEDKYFKEFCNFINYDTKEDNLIENRIEQFKEWRKKYNIYLIYFVGEKSKKFATKNIFSYIEKSLQEYSPNKNVFDSIWGGGYFDDHEYIRNNIDIYKYNDFAFVDFFAKYKIDDTVRTMYLNFAEDKINKFKNAEEYLRMELGLKMFYYGNKYESIYDVEDEFIDKSDLFNEKFIELYNDKMSKFNKVMQYIETNDNDIELVKVKINIYQCSDLDDFVEHI